jgi:glycosyltransferase involved in cell wall biosynthesis
LEARKFPSLSVFFPAYNDAPSLAALVRKTFATLERHVVDYEVIVVDDGSRDATGEVLEQLRREFSPWLRVVTHAHNRGYGGALRSGFAAAQKEFVFYTDGDGQYDPGELPRLLDLVGPATGLVNGYKLERHDPRHRVWIGNAYNFCARLLFRIRIRDIDCDYRLIRRALLEKIRLTSTSGTICVELVRKLELSGCQVVEAGVHHYPRLHGRSQFFRIRSLAVTLVQLARLWVRLAILPARRS